MVGQVLKYMERMGHKGDAADAEIDLGKAKCVVKFICSLKGGDGVDSH